MPSGTARGRRPCARHTPAPRPISDAKPAPVGGLLHCFGELRQRQMGRVFRHQRFAPAFKRIGKVHGPFWLAVSNLTMAPSASPYGAAEPLPMSHKPSGWTARLHGATKPPVGARVLAAQLGNARMLQHAEIRNRAAWPRSGLCSPGEITEPSLGIGFQRGAGSVTERRRTTGYSFSNVSADAAVTSMPRQSSSAVAISSRNTSRFLLGNNRRLPLMHRVKGWLRGPPPDHGPQSPSGPRRTKGRSRNRRYRIG